MDLIIMHYICSVKIDRCIYDFVKDDRYQYLSIINYLIVWIIKFLLTFDKT